MDDVVYPLESSWTVYIHTHSVSLTYSACCTKIGTFSTIGEFWMYWNNLPVEAVYKNCTYSKSRRVVAFSCFRDNILPEWEKTNNINGSEWGCREYLSVSQVREMWTDIALACIGENIPNCVGFRYVNKCNRSRHLHKLEIWMNTCNTTLVTETLRCIRKSLKNDHLKFTLMRHNDKKSQAIEYYRRKNV